MPMLVVPTRTVTPKAVWYAMSPSPGTGGLPCASDWNLAGSIGAAIPMLTVPASLVGNSQRKSLPCTGGPLTVLPVVDVISAGVPMVQESFDVAVVEVDGDVVGLATAELVVVACPVEAACSVLEV